MKMTGRVHPLLVFAIAAVVVFSGAALSGITGWVPGSASRIEHSGPKVDAPSAAPRPRADPASVPKRARFEDLCGHCGTIESVREVWSSGVGVLLDGSETPPEREAGVTHRWSVTAAIGALGDAIARDRVARKAQSARAYEITVRFENGSSSVVIAANRPAWRPGDRVRIVKGQIHSDV